MSSHTNNIPTPLPPPKGWLRLAFRMPIYLYRLGLGWLLGRWFLMVTHQGRKSGLKRYAVLEVVKHDQATEESIVAAAYAENADWYLNIQKTPALEIQIGRKRYLPQQRFLTAAETYESLADFHRRRPAEVSWLARFFGFDYDGADAGLHQMAAQMRMVAFRPKRDHG